MDIDNKYYSLIEKLVKENRKYPGYEAILDDIVEDVYKHSQVIISSIDNESVLNAYLEKVITTSIITVAKKMNFNNHTKHRVISEEYDIKDKSDDTESFKMDKSVDLNTLDINKQVVIEEIASDEKPVNEDIQLQEPGIDTIDDTEIRTDVVPEVFNNTNESSLEELISVHEDNDFNVLDVESDISTYETPKKADPELVDMMINTMNSDMVIDVSNNDDTNDVELDESLEYTEDLYSDSSDETVNYSQLSNIDNLDNLQVEDSNQCSEDIVDNDVEELNEPVELETDAVEVDNNISENNIEDIETIEMSDIQEPESVNDFEQQSAEIESITIDNESDLELNANDSEGDALSDNLVVQNEMPDELDVEIEHSSDYDNNILLEDDSDESVLVDDNNLIAEETNDNSIEMEEESDFNDMIDLSVEQIDDLNVELNDENHVDEIIDVSDDGSLYDEMVSDDSFDINIEQNDEVLDVNIENDDISMVDEPDLIKLDETNNIEVNSEFSDSQHKNIDYTAFEYEPNIMNSEDGDVSNISNKILELDVLKPNLQILKIFDLKYKQNLTLEQIAENLGIEKQDVVTALDELIDLI